MVNDDLVQIQNYCEEILLPLKYHTQSTEVGVKYIVTFSAEGISEEDYSILVLLLPIKIAPINCDILKKLK